MSQSNRGQWKNQLKKVRIASQFSQSDLADSLCVSQTTVAAIEGGKHSGRKYMDEIGEFFGYRPELIFPYYHYMDKSEIASVADISMSKVMRSVADGKVRTMMVGTKRLYHKDDIIIPEHLRVRKTSIRVMVKDFIRQFGATGVTTPVIVDSFGPFETPKDRERMKNTIQSLLSRYKEFVYVRDGRSYFWTVVDE